jgi:hypothetical protein
MVKYRRKDSGNIILFTFVYFICLNVFLKAVNIRFRYTDIIRLLSIVLLIAVLTSCKYLKQKLGIGEYSLKSAIEWAKADSTRIVDSLRRVEAKKPHKQVNADSVEKVLVQKRKYDKTITDSLTSLVNNVPEAAAGGTGYYVIAGGFANHNRAVEIAAKYKNLGFATTLKPFTKQTGEKVELVTVGRFSNIDKARAFLKDFKARHDSGAWIYDSK